MSSPDVGGHLAFEIMANASSFLVSSRKQRIGAAFLHIALEILAWVRSAATGRSKSLLGRASEPFSA